MKRSDMAASLGFLLISGVVVMTLALVLAFGSRSFPDDHGIDPESPAWLRCAAETIERHPSPFTTGGFRITATDGSFAIVEGTHRDTEIAVVDGAWIMFRWRWVAQSVELDCPDVGWPTRG